MSQKDDLKEIQEELKWIQMRSDERNTFTQRAQSKGIYGVLVPIGCLVTAGILATGVYNMVKRNSRKQQLLMRYRVLAQGVTVGLTMMALYQYRPS